MSDEENLEELKKKYPHRSKEWLKRSLDVLGLPDTPHDYFTQWTSGPLVNNGEPSSHPFLDPIKKD